MDAHAGLRQPVGHLRRDGLRLLAPDQAVSLQLAQALRQHLGRDARYYAAQGAEALRPLRAQDVNELRLPLPRKSLEKRRSGADGLERRDIALGGFHLVTTILLEFDV